MSEERVYTHHYFTYETLIDRVHNWDIQVRIKQKYQAWQLKHSLPQLSSTWLTLIHHSLIYYLLKNIDWIFSQLQTEWIITHSHSMKSAYSKIALQKSQCFDFKLVILVKTITYFIGSHIRQILADCSLETDIYQLIIHNLLGISVEQSAYPCLLKQMRSAQAVKKERQSRNLESVVERTSLNDINVKTLLVPTRRQANKQTVDKLLQITQQHSNLLEFKTLLKENLYVKPISRPQTPKYSINQLRQLDQESADENVLREKQTTSLPHGEKQFKKKKQTMHSNQLSTAFNYNSQLKLTDVKKFAIQRSAGKLEPLRHSYHLQMTKKQSKLQLKGWQSKIKRDSKSKMKLENQNAMKTTKEWHQLVKNMKNELYGSQPNASSKNNKESRNYDCELDYPKLRLRDTTTISNKKSTNSYQPNYINNSIRFRKLNLMNNPNIVVLGQNGADSKQQEQVVQLAVKSYSLYHMKEEYPLKSSQLQLSRHKPSFLTHNSSLYCEYEHTIQI